MLFKKNIDPNPIASKFALKGSVSFRLRTLLM